SACIDEVDAVGAEHDHLVDAREVTDLLWAVLAAGEVDEIRRAGVDDGVGLTVEREGDEIAGGDFDLVLADLGCAFALDDEAPLLLYGMAMQNEGLFAGRDTQQVDVGALEASRAAQAEELRV